MTEPAPVLRLGARVILVDEADRVLLLHGRDPARPDRPSWWITAGGGREPGESSETAARREVLEETGIVLGDLGPVVLRRVVEFEFEGTRFRQDEVFYLVRVQSTELTLDLSGWNEIERRSLTEVRWWTLAELAATADLIFPEGLPDLLRDNGIGWAGG
jgi:8-oxo-dGTP pyrophosphatase MutT (NUDIX family)